MKSLRFPLIVVTLALMLSLVSCAAPAAPTAAPPQAPAPATPQPTVVPTQALPPTPEPAATPTEGEAYPAPKEEPTPGREAYPAPAAEPAAPTPSAAAPAPSAAAPAPSAAVPQWSADGLIGAEEYSDTTSIGGVTLWWRHDGEYLYLAAEARTRGWLAVGLDPEDRMKGANYLIAAYDGEARIVDAFGTAPTGAAHPADTTLGGTDDVVAYAVVEENGVTRFEAQIPLDSGDAFDKPLQPGQTYPVIVALGTADDFTAPHSFRGAGSITLSPTP